MSRDTPPGDGHAVEPSGSRNPWNMGCCGAASYPGADSGTAGPHPVSQVLDRRAAAGANRLHKVLEDAGIKLASVASDILGQSGRAMLAALVGGTTHSRRAR